ncbi:DEAD/DEAH box helicase [Bifidobacterium gallicum]|uniref:DEAD/DEAH box helicase n=1 Tax=Bifidobacterium gallicum DSM 20093 = LMG 11596 TaxID=561180 RepID=D1NRV9_9BIFI|nr:DEAD/DEAH box helicase [Bifidobacterium gallicum]EFA23411.1 DEAD/DEAH box helicase [Bifidobacterium gallicum DSM 20093 = LMG 11596]
MSELMQGFTQQTQRWFEQTFGKPTDVQRQAWPLIRSGADTLVIAPTGSGKTLAAFLAALDTIMCERARSVSGAVQPRIDHVDLVEDAPQTAKPARSKQRAKTKGVRVLYISPLKALGVDVAKNLDLPLRGISDEYAAEGLEVPEVRVAMRSGDTDAKARAAITRRPPDILVTTPESLYLMLTSKAREILRHVDTVIIDEVHAVAGTKRGSHLALSLERLDALLEHPAQRIGLSATVHPMEETAAFLGGSRPVQIVNAAGAPSVDLRVVDVSERAVTRRTNLIASEGEPGIAPTTGDASRRNSALHTPTTSISGVTPAMQRLAARKAETAADSPSAQALQAAQRFTAHAAMPAPHHGLPMDASATTQKTFSIWPQVQRSVLDMILEHRTTLVFVNSRGVAERLTAQINDLYAQRVNAGRGDAIDTAWGQHGDGPDEPMHRRSSYGSTSMLVSSPEPEATLAMAHHGSVSKDRRKQIEDDLKRGKLRCVIATSSLELGIDMGSVDLVIQIAPPLSISSGLQRVGRADHTVGGTSHAVFYPLTRQEIVATGTAVEHMRSGSLEPTMMVRNALDVLAQQTVAAASVEPVSVDTWYALVRKAAPYAGLGRDVFETVIKLLTGAYNSEEFSAFRPPLMLDEDSGMISARPGAQRLAVTSGGTIPDRGLYTVVLPEAQAGKGPKRVGELDEEMVYETRVGDIITLGTSTWQVQEITNDRVVVIPAPGRSARLPFWHGDQAGRSYTFGLAQAQWMHDMNAGFLAATNNGTATEPTFNDETLERLHNDGFDDNAINDLAGFLADQRAATTVIPDATRIVVERTRSEEGDWTVLIHSQLGRRVHEPWALAINARLQQRYGFSGQIFAADDGIVIRLPDGDGTIDVIGSIRFDVDDLNRIVTEQVGGSVLFASRFREVAARSLFMPRMNPGKRVPLWQQRLRASQLLAAARPIKDFPLIMETTRECLQDVYDLPALREVMGRIGAGQIMIDEVTTDYPSPMAENLMFGFVGSVMYEGDTPLAERNTQLLSMDPAMLEQLLGEADYASVLDSESIDETARALEGRTFWNALDEQDITGRVSRYAKTHAPFTAAQMIADLNIDAEAAVRALDALKERGEVLQGRFDARMSEDVEQWVHQSVFRMIRSRSLRRARAAIRPVSAADYQRFLLDLQGVGPVGGQRHDDTEGVLRVLEQCEGVELPLHVWEGSVLPARVRNYTHAMLDALVLEGTVVWVMGERGVRWYPADSVQLASWAARVHEQAEQAGSADTDADLSSALDSVVAGESNGEWNGDGETEVQAWLADDTCRSLCRAILAVLAQGGAYGASQLADLVNERWMDVCEPLVDDGTGELVMPAWTMERFEQSLWRLVRQGLVTNSALEAVRAHETADAGTSSAGGAAAGRSKAAARSAHSVRSMRSVRSIRHRLPARMPQTKTLAGLWRLVTGDQELAAEVSAEQRTIDLVEMLLDRYGPIAPALVDMAGVPGGFSSLYPVLTRMEERGLLVRGMFVEGFGAAQFAVRDTVDVLRGISATTHAHAVVLNAIDPAVLYGAAVPWPALPDDAGKPLRKDGSLVVLRDGVPIVFAALRGKRLMAFSTVESLLESACAELAYQCHQTLGAPVTFTVCNAQPIRVGQPIFHALRAAGFTPTPQGMKLYR